jgi:predicted nucleic acid-binding Zn ribbon protein
MPTYDFICDKCGYHEELFCSPDEATEADGDFCVDFSHVCTGHMRRQISAGAGVIFKGSGFYCTDYRKSSPPREDV